MPRETHALSRKYFQSSDSVSKLQADKGVDRLTKDSEKVEKIIFQRLTEDGGVRVEDMERQKDFWKLPGVSASIHVP